jgi:hypothetical protein
MTAPITRTAEIRVDTPAGLVATLQQSARAAIEILDAAETDGGTERVLAAVQRLSDELLRVVTHLDFDTPVAWRLLRARESLDSHVLAATALASTERDSPAQLRMLRRGLDRVVSELPDTSDI